MLACLQVATEDNLGVPTLICQLISRTRRKRLQTISTYFPPWVSDALRVPEGPQREQMAQCGIVSSEAPACHNSQDWASQRHSGEVPSRNRAQTAHHTGGGVLTPLSRLIMATPSQFSRAPCPIPAPTPHLSLAMTSFVSSSRNGGKQSKHGGAPQTQIKQSRDRILSLNCVTRN